MLKLLQRIGACLLAVVNSPSTEPEIVECADELLEDVQTEMHRFADGHHKTEDTDDDR